MRFDEVVRAIDVGFGNTKYIQDYAYGAPMKCEMFPSIVALATNTDLGAGVMGKRNTTTVSVRGVEYEVGKDSRLALGASHASTMDHSYCLSDEYMALARGAMKFMGVTRIDLLVLGLPVSVASDQNKRKRLVDLMVGRHEISEGCEVDVHAVKILPQPLGAFFDYAISSQRFSEVKKQKTLVIDPGYNTFDWYFVADEKPVEARSGDYAGGMFSVCRAVADAIDRSLTDLSEIDKALRSGAKKIRVSGQEVDLVGLMPIAQRVAREAVSAMAQRVRGGHDVENIVVAGGSAQFFLDAIRERYQQHVVTVLDQPIFFNVRGFQMTGVQLMMEMKARGVRA